MNKVCFSRSSHQRCSVKKGALKNFANFTGIHLSWSLFLIKLQTLRRFPVKFAKCLPLRTTAFVSKGQITEIIILWEIISQVWICVEFSINFYACVSSVDLKGNTEREETPTGSSELLQIQHGEYEFTAARCHHINPFKPHSMANKLTLFKQRWLHAFPTDVKGLTVQEHQKVVTDEVLPPAKVQCHI